MPLVPIGDHRRVDAFRLGRSDDLVVDVRDVARVDETVRAKFVADKPGERVEHHRRPRIADMGPPVDGGPADIHGDALRVERDERALLARQRIVKADHCSSRLGVPPRFDPVDDRPPAGIEQRIGARLGHPLRADRPRGP